MAQGGDSLVHLGELQHMVAQLGSCSKPTPAWLISPWAMPKLCMLMSLTITSRYRSTSHISSIFPEWDDIPCPHGQSHWPGIGSSGPHHSLGLRQPATRRSPVRPDPKLGGRMGPGWFQSLQYERPLCTFLHLGLQFCSCSHLSPRSHQGSTTLLPGDLKYSNHFTTVSWRYMKTDLECYSYFYTVIYVYPCIAYIELEYTHWCGYFVASLASLQFHMHRLKFIFVAPQLVFCLKCWKKGSHIYVYSLNNTPFKTTVIYLNLMVLEVNLPHFISPESLHFSDLVRMHIE